MGLKEAERKICDFGFLLSNASVRSFAAIVTGGASGRSSALGFGFSLKRQETERNTCCMHCMQQVSPSAYGYLRAIAS